jgi:hypothetical protein
MSMATTDCPPRATPCTPRTRQQLLFLWLSHPNPPADAVAWSLFDGAAEPQRMSGDADTPPYPSVIAAMRDGWRVIQVAQQDPPALGLEQRTSYLPYEFILERLVEIDHG